MAPIERSSGNEMYVPLADHRERVGTLEAEVERLRGFVRRFRSWATTADLNRLAHEADDILRDV